MKKAILLPLLIAICLIGNAQYDVEWGPTYKKGGGIFSRYYLAGATDDNYRVMARPKKDNTLLTYNYDHRLIKTQTVPFIYDGENLSPSDFIETASGTFAYMDDYDKKSNMKAEFVSRMESSGKFGTLKKINSYEYIKKAGAKISWGNWIGADIDDDLSTMITSPNAKYILSTSSHSLTETSKSQKEAMNIIVYNDNFEKVWSKIEDFKGQDDDDIDIVQYFVDDEGIVYAGAMIWKDRSDRQKGIPNYDYKLYKIAKDAIQEFEINLGGIALPQDAGIFYGEDNIVYLGGLYTDRGSTKHRANGVFYVKLNPESGKIIDSKSYEFTPQLLEGLIRDRKIKKSKGLSFFNIKYMIFSDNKDFSFIAEEVYETTHTETYDGKTQSYILYHSNEIIVPRFSQEGDLVSIQKIDKDFLSRTPLNTSYTLGVYGDKTYLVFNDRKKMGERVKGNVRGGVNSRYTDLVVLDGEGKIEFWETLFSNREIDTEFWPSLSVQVQNSNKILLYGSKGKSYQFGTITIK